MWLVGDLDHSTVAHERRSGAWMSWLRPVLHAPEVTIKDELE